MSMFLSASTKALRACLHTTAAVASRTRSWDSLYRDDHRAFRQTVDNFVERHVEGNIDKWETAGRLPRTLFKEAGAAGLLSLGYPAQYGGSPSDVLHMVSLHAGLAAAGSGGLLASLLSHGIAGPLVVAHGSVQMKAEVLPAVIRGERIMALAVTEPSGGSDVANLATRAVLDGDHFVVNGEKTFITSGMQADYIVVAVRTGSEGAKGISLLLVDGDSPGLQRTALSKMGWHCSDTAALHFDGCRVPRSRFIGTVNGGFRALMGNFNMERFGLASMACAFARVCTEEATAWCSQRKTFGVRLVEHQAARHRLVDMHTQLLASEAALHAVAQNILAGQMPVADICLLKNLATNCAQLCASNAIFLLGGMGFMKGSKSERIYRETMVLAIGGGSTDILKDLAAKHLGLL